MDKVKESQNYLTNFEQEKIFVYSSQNYGKNEANALKMLNDLSRTNRLDLAKRKISSKKSKISMSAANIDPKLNNHLFIQNLNNSALACYLKVLEAPEIWWNAYSLNQNQRNSTNFRILNSKRDSSVDSLHDEEFVSNYLKQMIKIHNQNTKKINLSLNAVQNKDDKYPTRHLYRSFRVLGLRNSRNSDKLKEKFHDKYNFNEIVDIRTTFKINLLNDFSGYEYSIDCELSYYQLKSKEYKNYIYSFVDSVNVNSNMPYRKNDTNKKISDFLQKETSFKVNV